ncbi:DUF3800 domain-containing protein [Streptomyces ipomoeae]|uniref:DUF3800 domain-containing protein n=1 Tax=Streptomyces ipomoeae TaxID=103232 RepID=UPI0011461E44|nr:DUF3800 domain-containing protein [Streptomyces ipomoeae]MDX2937801.1 hypothetical protein [Streptomyces ipomoeae]TQE27430.1 hypothetical protein SipoB123_11760 [Streptomyces ipomoeae]
MATEILGYLYERIEMQLESSDERRGVIVDILGGGNKDHSKWLSEALDLTTIGTRYAKPERVVMPIVTAPSDHVPHLRLADLVTAATTAAVAGREAGIELVDVLEPLARRNAYGYIGGAGLVFWPPNLNDLYHWVLWENTYAKGGTGHPIGPTDSQFSQPGRPFQNSSGLPQSAPSPGSATTSPPNAEPSQ